MRHDVMRGDEGGRRVNEIVLSCEHLEGGDLEGQVVLLGIGVMEGGVGHTGEGVLEVRGDRRWVEDRIGIEMLVWLKLFCGRWTV